MRIWRNLRRDMLAVISLFILALVMIAGIFAPWFAPHDPLKVNMALRYGTPTWEYLLGNDHLGRCILSRLIYGIRPSVLWVIAALAVSLCAGGIMGFIAGYFRGKTDAIIMRLCDVLLSFPGYVMTLAIIGVFGVGLENILIAFIIMKWTWFARMIRTSVMQYTESNYIRFSKAAGVSTPRILYKHLLPLAMSDIAVLASSSLGSMILQISGFSFLGLGIQAPSPEWGMMLNEAREVMFTRPELMLAPGLAIIVIVTSFNFLSDALQNAINPKLASSMDNQRRKSRIFGMKIKGIKAVK
ncbi:ABC transporter permease subunit [Neobacillus mesonae]|nr:ABC transporter permease subunit [Neobacillus mesonae]